MEGRCAGDVLLRRGVKEHPHPAKRDRKSSHGVFERNGGHCARREFGLTRLGKLLPFPFGLRTDADALAQALEQSRAIGLRPAAHLRLKDFEVRGRGH